MKTIRKIHDRSIHRLPDDQANRAVENGVAEFVPKSLWKRLVRDKEESQSKSK